MPSSDTTVAASSSMAGRSNKRTKTIVLKLPSTTLSRWPDIRPTSDEKKSEGKTKSSATPSSSPSSPHAPASSADAGSDAVAPAADTAAAPAASPEASKKKGVPGPKPGSKRGAPVETVPKPRGKPGPKKKPRLEDGTIDHSASGRPSVGGSAHHKLGPKANQGAINAGLRALDRTGKQCRKWERKSFNLKSFTGVAWGVPSWRAPPKPKPTEEGDTPKPEDLPINGDTDNKASNSSGKSNIGEADGTPLATNGFSSPAPAVAVAS